MRKGLLVTSVLVASTLLLASCAKTVSYEDAKKHIETNFTSTEEKLFDFEDVTKVTEVDGVFKLAGLEVGEKTDTGKGMRGVIKAKALELFGDKATYKVDGKKLSAEHNLDVKAYLKETLKEDIPDNAQVSGKVFSKISTDDDGYIVSEYYRVENLEFSYNSDLGLAVKGKLSMESTVTYTARPAN